MPISSRTVRGIMIALTVGLGVYALIVWVIAAIGGCVE
jgi:hypothetical protein